MDDREMFIITETVKIHHKPSGKTLVAQKIGPKHWELEVQGAKIRARSKSRICEVAKGDLITEARADQVLPNRSIYEDRGLSFFG